MNESMNSTMANRNESMRVHHCRTRLGPRPGFSTSSERKTPCMPHINHKYKNNRIYPPTTTKKKTSSLIDIPISHQRQRRLMHVSDVLLD